MWWQGSCPAERYAAVDKADLVVGNAASRSTDEREARVGPAVVVARSAAPTPRPRATSIRALVQERSCASGKSPEGRVEPPQIEVTDAAITITFEIRRQPGGQDCQGNPPFPVTIELPEPLGDRALLDGGSRPAARREPPPT